jgi:micrococcal nuclease
MKMSNIYTIINTLCCFCIKSNNTRCVKNIRLDINNSQELHNKFIEWKDTTQFIPPLDGGEVIKVYDGDTITIASYLPYPNSPLYRFSVRLNGIDAPEIKGKTEDEKAAAKISQKALEELILHKNVTLVNKGTEKYGRILADVFYDEVNISKWMLENRYAVEYDGSTKKSPDSWLEYQKRI